MCVSVRVSVAVKGHDDPSNIKAGSQFRGLVHCRHSGKHGGPQADMVLEKEWRVLHLDLQGAEKELCVSEPGLEHLRPQIPGCVFNNSFYIVGTLPIGN